MLPSILSNVLFYALVPAAVVFAGGAASAFRPPGKNLLGAVQHFAAGMVLAAAASGVMPATLRGQAPFVAVGGFALGVALVLGVKWLLVRAGKGTNASRFAIVAAGVVISGLLVGIGLAAGQRLGVLLTAALAAEALFLALSGSAVLSRAGASRGRVLLTSLLLALLLLAGATASGILFTLRADALGFLLPFGVGILLCFAMSELLGAAREHRRSLLLAAAFCSGFFAWLVINITT